MKVLITGTGGFIGQNAAEYLIQNGADVTGIYHRRKPERISCRLYACDLAKERIENYIGKENIGVGKEMLEKEITVARVTTALIDGMTYYYITDVEGKRYRASIKVAEEKLPFVEKGNKLMIGYYREKTVTEVNQLK